MRFVSILLIAVLPALAQANSGDPFYCAVTFNNHPTNHTIPVQTTLLRENLEVQTGKIDLPMNPSGPKKMKKFFIRVDSMDGLDYKWVKLSTSIKDTYVSVSGHDQAVLQLQDGGYGDISIFCSLKK